MARFERLRDIVNTAHLDLGSLVGDIIVSEPVMAAASEPTPREALRREWFALRRDEPSNPRVRELEAQMDAAEDEANWWAAADEAFTQAEGDEQEAMQLLQEQELVEQCNACGEWFDPTDVQIAIHEGHVQARLMAQGIEQNRLFTRLTGLFPQADPLRMWSLADRIRLGADLPPVPVAD